MVVIFTDNNNKEISIDKLNRYINQYKLKDIQEWLKKTSITNNKDEWIFRLGPGYNEVELKLCNIVQKQPASIPLELYIPQFVTSVKNPYKVIVVNNKQNSLVCVHSGKIEVHSLVGNNESGQKYQGKINTDISDMQIVPDEYYREHLRDQHAQKEQNLQNQTLCIDGLVKSLDKETIQLINLDNYEWINKKQEECNIGKPIGFNNFAAMAYDECGYMSQTEQLKKFYADYRKFNRYLAGIKVKSLLDSSYNKSLEKIRLHWNIRKDIYIDSAYEMFNDIDQLVEADINIDMSGCMNKNKIINQNIDDSIFDSINCMNCRYRQGKSGYQSACPAICAESCITKGWFAGCNNLRHMRLSGNKISLGAILAGMQPQLVTLDLTNATLDLRYWDYKMLSEQFKPLRNCNVYISNKFIDNHQELYLVELENHGYIKNIVRK